jgi:hypothetical protein
MTAEEPDDTPEYYRAKAERNAYLKRIEAGLERGVDDDVAISTARLIRRFGVTQVVAAVDEFIENLPSTFERRWRKRRTARLQAEEEARLNDRNPNRAGRKRKRTDEALLGVWLVVTKCMRTGGVTAVRACQLLTKPPSRREAPHWPGLRVHRDYTVSDPNQGSYDIRTAETLRDVYYDALTRYESGPDRLRRHWESLLQGFAPPAVNTEEKTHRRPE